MSPPPSDSSYVSVHSSSNESIANSLNSRPLTITSGSNQVDIPIPSQPYQSWIVGEVVRDEFQRSLLTNPLPQLTTLTNDDDEEEEDSDSPTKSAAQIQFKSESNLVLTSSFLRFLSNKVNSNNSILPILESTWTYFSTTFLSNNDIHKLASTLDTEARSSVLRSYYEALVVLNSQGKPTSVKIPKVLELASNGQAEVYALFGGQGNNEVSF